MDLTNPVNFLFILFAICNFIYLWISSKTDGVIMGNKELPIETRGDYLKKSRFRNWLYRIILVIMLIIFYLLANFP